MLNYVNKKLTIAIVNKDRHNKLHTFEIAVNIIIFHNLL